MRNFFKSICWWALPLVAGVGIGHSLGSGKTAAAPEGDPKPAITDSATTEASTPPPDSPAVDPAPATAAKANTPVNLDELLALSRQAGNHAHIAHALLGVSLAEVPEEQVVAWFHELVARMKRRAEHEYHMVEDHALTAVSEQLVRRLPELALQELGKGYQPLAPMLAAHYPQRIPEFLGQIENPHHRRAMLFEHLIGLGNHDLRRAYVEEHGNAEDLEHFDKEMGAEIAHNAIYSASYTPEDLLAIIHQAGDSAHSLTAAASKIAQSFESPQAAIEFARANGFSDLPGAAQHRFYGEVLARYAADDPQAAGAWIATLPEDSISKILNVSLGAMTWTSPEQAKELIRGLDPSLLPGNAYEVVARGLSRQDKGALDWYFANTNDGANHKGLANVLHMAVGRNPEGVLDFLSDNPEFLNRKTDHSPGLVGRIVTADPAIAELLLGKLEGAKSIEANGIAIGRSWARSDAAAARAHLETLDDPAVRAAFIEGIAWAENDWQGTFEWARNLEGTERDRGLAVTLYKAKNNPVASAAAATEWLNDAPPRAGEPLAEMTKNAITNVGIAIAETAPTEAGDWATSLPEGPAREQAIASVSEKWSSFDPAGTSEWLVDLPASTARDTAVGNLVSNITDDPVGAFSWSLIVTDPAKRGELLGGVVKRWRHSDPDAARQAIESAEELAPAERQQLLQQFDDAR